MTHTTFKIDNTTANNNYSFLSTNYSKILDNIIATNIKDNNKYLNIAENNDDLISKLINSTKKKHNTTILYSDLLKGDDEFTKAANFLANYKKDKAPKKLPFIFGKTYKLIDGTPIAFYDDEIQIGMDLYSYNDFSNITFLKKLSSTTKDIIINIYNAGNITININ